MPEARILAALALLVGGSLLAAQESKTSQDPAQAPPAAPPAAERSTGQVETAIEPAAPPPPTSLVLPADRPVLVQDGKLSATATAHYVVTPPADRMIEIRIRSGDTYAAFSIFRGDRAEAESGTSRDDGAVGWISSTEQGGPLRIVVWTTSRAESAFQLLVRVHAAEAETPPTRETPAPAAGSAEE